MTNALSTIGGMREIGRARTVARVIMTALGNSDEQSNVTQEAIEDEEGHMSFLTLK
jgi:hypothetical protein